jgi:hypothetical protein
MWNKAALLVAALVLVLPAFADNPSNSNTTVIKPKTPAPNKTFEVNNLTYGVANNTTVAHGAGGAGKSSLGLGAVNANMKNPCNQPNPPRTCARPKPPH